MFYCNWTTHLVLWRNEIMERGKVEKKCTGVAEWADRYVNFLKGCKNNCAYCYAAKTPKFAGDTKITGIDKVGPLTVAKWREALGI